ncbi:hypothetical protein PORY_000150 [Pneumocystis oryctolagi]|uniref:Uncharacterized protein n=1 Tax=Pneumocystis oryctolagi TaxID=42067 RepID=A0ACB7CHB1_9ASCO|nr:hypothetical protein PORY_000150 [Pneumocystis oryctolagi]
MSQNYDIINTDEFCDKTNPTEFDLEFQNFHINDNIYNTQDRFNIDNIYQDVYSEKLSIWSIEYYSKFFNVDSNHVIERYNPDLYGPFWVMTTVISTIFFSLTITEWTKAHLSKTFYNYDLSTFTSACSLIYTYNTVIPIGIWGLMIYYKCELNLIKYFCLYGYSMSIWIPISHLILFFFSNIIRWISIIIGFGISSLFLYKELNVIVNHAKPRTRKLILSVIILCHGFLNSGKMSTSCRFYENKYPDVDDLVMVNGKNLFIHLKDSVLFLVKQIQEMGAYVQLLEYNNIEGMILLSELSRRRIRSIQKLIRIGRNEVVVVLRVDKEKGYIDLSKRRVSPEDIVKCEDKFNKSKTVHSILRNVAEKHSIPLEELYTSIGWPLYKKYGHAYDAFKFAIVNSNSVFEGLYHSNPQVIQDLISQITRRLTPQAVKIRADVEVTCFEYDGINAVKRALKAAEAKNSKDVLIKVKLVAPPLYVVTTNALDKKLGIQTLEDALEEIKQSIISSGGDFFVKMKPKAVNEVDELELQALMQRMERENAEKSGDDDDDESYESLIFIKHSRNDKLMNHSKFISPLLKRPFDNNDKDSDNVFLYNCSNSMQKRTKNSQENYINNSRNETTYLKKKNISLKYSLLDVENKGHNVTKENSLLSSEGKCYNVLWRKQTTKKNKSWQGDGILSFFNNICLLKDLNENILAKSYYNSSLLSIGDQIKIGDKEVEIDSILNQEDCLSKKSYIESLNDSKIRSPLHSTSIKKFKTPFLIPNTPSVQISKLQQAQHGPNEPEALVLPRPKIEKFQGENNQIIDVVVDPLLSKHLRPHQREGVKFLYECVMKMKEFEGQGAILADEMGLGKSLQIITLLWTLLKQSPYYGTKSIIKRALIVCPVTLIDNWKQEFRKWIGGNERIGLFIVDSNTNIKNFSVGNVYSVMIIGYERLRNVYDQLKDANIDIIICDEGHRLKSASNKSAQAIKSLKTRKRIILNLGEFYVMVDFVNPGLLENYATFKKEFENPIIKSRQVGCMKKDKEKGRARSEQLTSLTKMFVLRRTSEILNEYLPPMIEYIIFCKPTSLQVDIYSELINMSLLNLNSENSNSAIHLQSLTCLKKVCNSPTLLFQKKNEQEFNPFYTNIKHKFSSKHPKNSGKLLVLDKFLEALKVTNEKVVIVSHYTQTLQILENLLISKSLPYLRLDGQTTNTKRQEYVDKFNSSNSDETFAFLLSAKSGGYGLNLIGASRLILFDIDWNPRSVDLQAMSRIRRDGQQKKTFVYRFLMSGMIDEKIYQRQITKQGLSDTFIDSKASFKKDSFTQEELKSLFFYQDTSCQTHELLGCECQGDGLNIKTNNFNELSDEEMDLSGWVKSSEVLNCQTKISNYLKKKHLYSINEYSHIKISKNNDYYNIIKDNILRKISQEDNEINNGCISYIFEKVKSV